MKPPLLLTTAAVFVLASACVAMWMMSGRKQIISSEVPTGEAVSNATTVAHDMSVVKTDRAERMREWLSAANVNITFWGKVADESGAGIPGAVIKYRIQRAGRLEAGHTMSVDNITSSTRSDANGLFSINNARGTSFSVMDITKEGYKIGSSQDLTFGYFGMPDTHNPKNKSPQVFTMISNGKHGDIGILSTELRLLWNGEAVRIDLNSGNPTSSGELVVTASRTASTGRFGWSLTLAIDGGGLKEAEAGKALIAPEGGYSSVWQCRYEPDANPWRFARDVNVYYKLNGVFGRMELQIYADAGPDDVSIHLRKFVNNSGGRNTDAQP